MGGYADYEEELTKLASVLGGDDILRDFMEFAFGVLEQATKHFGFYIPSDMVKGKDDLKEVAGPEDLLTVGCCWLDGYVKLVPLAKDWIAETPLIWEKATGTYSLRNYIKPSGGDLKLDKNRAEAFACAIRVVAKNLPFRSETVEFIHSTDYHSVTLRGEQFSLSDREAEVIELLHQHYREGTPYPGKDYVLAQVGSDAEYLKDCFREYKTYKSLIRKVGNNFCLNI